MQPNSEDNADQLLEKFVATFEPSVVGDTEYEGPLAWKEIAEPSILTNLHTHLNLKLPPLYERLILTYRWFRVATKDDIEFFGNWPGENPDQLIEQMLGDPGLTESLRPKGFIQFGSGPEWNDPLCFDTNRPAAGGEFPIVQIDHEQILCNYRIKVIREVAPSFEEFVRYAIS